MIFQGYRRPDGRIGIRNHVVVVPTSVCSSEVAVRIAQTVAGAVPLPHANGCCQMGEDYAQTVRTLAGLALNPNVGAALVVALGCEGIPPAAIVEPLRAAGKPVEALTIQTCGGLARTLEAGALALARLAAEAARAPRAPATPADLVIGLECGGSDATSGLVANPVVGRVTDWVVAAGGTAILSETTEMIGAEHILAARARTPAVAESLVAAVRAVEAQALRQGTDIRGTQPTPGNIQGGITTIEEKSLGCVYKAGLARLEGVLPYGAAPAGRGLYFMDTPGQDIESITGMVAGGAQLALFTTGRGTPTGCPIAPVIKITGNPETARRLADMLDFSAGAVLESGASPDRAAEELIAFVGAVCDGQLTQAERSGHREFAITRIGHTF